MTDGDDSGGRCRTFTFDLLSGLGFPTGVGAELLIIFTMRDDCIIFRP